MSIQLAFILWQNAIQNFQTCSSIIDSPNIMNVPLPMVSTGSKGLFAKVLLFIQWVFIRFRLIQLDYVQAIIIITLVNKMYTCFEYKIKCFKLLLLLLLYLPHISVLANESSLALNLFTRKSCSLLSEVSTHQSSVS